MTRPCQGRTGVGRGSRLGSSRVRAAKHYKKLVRGFVSVNPIRPAVSTNRHFSVRLLPSYSEWEPVALSCLMMTLKRNGFEPAI